MLVGHRGVQPVRDHRCGLLVGRSLGQHRVERSRRDAAVEGLIPEEVGIDPSLLAIDESSVILMTPPLHPY